MKILISNDDGIDAPGIQALAEAAADFGEVTVVAPHRERSTAGHSLTLHKPLRVYEVRDGFFSTSGTPADCVYLGIREVLKEKPDLILAGINAGANLGTDIHYSGTVAAAREGALMNIPSIAFSLVDQWGISKHPREPLNYETGKYWARQVLESVQGVKFPDHSLLNVNIPNLAQGDVKGMKVARQGFRFYSSEVVQRTDPRGKPYFWIGGAYEGYVEGGPTDCEALNEGFVALAPLTIDATDLRLFEALSTHIRS